MNAPLNVDSTGLECVGLGQEFSELYGLVWIGLCVWVT